MAGALDTIERTGRTALTELRHLLGLLHETGDALPAATALARRPRHMVTALRTAGHQVSVEVTGDPSQLPTGIDLSAYRILQEAVTNALKHAPGSTVDVRVEHRPDAVAVEVTNHAPDAGTGPRLEGGGRGLVGMRERVRMFGGQLTAAPTEAAASASAPPSRGGRGASGSRSPTTSSSSEPASRGCSSPSRGSRWSARLLTAGRRSRCAARPGPMSCC